MVRTLLTVVGAWIVAFPFVSASHRQSEPAAQGSPGSTGFESMAVGDAVNPLSPQELVGTYLATHKDWRIGFLTLRADAEFLDERGSSRGTWALDDGTLVLKWTGYPE